MGGGTRWLVAGLVAAGASTWAGTSSAEPPRDNFLNAPPAGTFAHIDGYTVGSQFSIENRADLEPGMSMLHTRVSQIISFPYSDTSFNLDARVFLFTFGASAGYRVNWRNHTFAPGEDTSRDVRNDREADGDFDGQKFGYYEGRGRVVIPLEMFFMINTFTVRNEEREDNSFDWFHAMTHDAGTLWKNETTLFFRHRDFGAIGPYVRYIDVPRFGKRDSDLHYGIVYGTRPGWKKERYGTDLFLLQAVFNFGDDDFGLHAYRVPMYFLAVYRSTFEL